MSRDFCDLCGLPLRGGAVEADFSGRQLRFCCFGCRQVYALILESTDSPDPERFRETEIFKRCQEAGLIPASQEDAPSGNATRPAAAEASPKDRGGLEEGVRNGSGSRPLLSLDLSVRGMWCPVCAWAVEEGLKRDRGVRRADCRFALDRLRVDYDPVLTSPQRIRERVHRLGYRTRLPEEGTGEGEADRDLVRLGISSFLTLNVMMLSFALYSGFFTELGPGSAAKISWPLVLLTSAVFAYGGAPIHRQAASGILHRAPGMEALISLGAGAAFLYSLFNWMQGSIHVYFDTVCMLITLVLIGRFLERRTRERILARLGSFYSLLPAKVRICTGSFPEGRYADARALGKGDVFLTAAGENVAADGVVAGGSARVDESSLTGEARPALKAPGDFIRSGTRVLEGEVRVRAEAVGRDSTAGRLIEVMEKGLAGKTGLESRTDKALRWFVPGIVLLAAGTGTVCLASGMQAGASLLRGITVLVISCPCALGVAVPLARVAGISLAAGSGVLVHDFDAFERIRDAEVAVFDKTGTLTTGNWRLAGIEPAGDRSGDWMLAAAAGLETFSRRNVAKAVADGAAARGIAPREAREVEEHENGIRGYVEGELVAVGSAAFAAGALGPGEAIPEAGRDRHDPAVSRVYVAAGGSFLGTLLFGDSLRSTAAETVAGLKKLGLEVALVSGDDARTAEFVGRELGIEQCQGGMLPLDKAGFVDRLKSRGRRVIMAGDGLNDAPALAAADVGISAGGGDRIGREAPSLTLMGGEPDRILSFYRLAGDVRRTVRQNLAFSFAYNAMAIPLAMSGLLNPLIAAGAMSLSSLSVTANSLLLVRRKEGAGVAGRRAAERDASRERVSFSTGSPST